MSFSFDYGSQALLLLLGQFELELPVGLNGPPMLLGLQQDGILALNGGIRNHLVLLQGVHLSLKLLHEFLSFLNIKVTRRDDQTIGIT